MSTDDACSLLSILMTTILLCKLVFLLVYHLISYPTAGDMWEQIAGDVLPSRPWLG
jgi:hypothetical protein